MKPQLLIHVPPQANDASSAAVGKVGGVAARPGENIYMSMDNGPGDEEEGDEDVYRCVYLLTHFVIFVAWGGEGSF